VASADAAVRRALDGLRRQQAKALWEFLPPSYRRDAEELVREVARGVEDAAWEPLVKTINKTRQVLARRGSLLIEPDGSGDSDPAAITRLRRLLDAVGESELADLRRLRTIDVAQFLDKTGGELLTTFARAATPTDTRQPNDDAFSRLADVEVELVSSVNDTAVIRVRWPGQPASEHEFVRVEGHWIPRTLADGWSAQLAAVREQSLGWANHLREQPELWQARLRDIDQWLDELDATRTPADARRVWQAGASRLWAAWSPTELPNAATPEGPTAKPTRVKRTDTEVLLPDEPGK
jgi:hypothetical protein